jgi:hypothetical protein
LRRNMCTGTPSSSRPEEGGGGISVGEGGEGGGGVSSKAPLPPSPLHPTHQAARFQNPVLRLARLLLSPFCSRQLSNTEISDW